MSLSTKSIQTPVQLYRHLLKSLRKLPDDARTHYRHHIRQAYKSHADENSPERIEQIVKRALDDLEWIMKKYT